MTDKKPDVTLRHHKHQVFFSDSYHTLKSGVNGGTYYLIRESNGWRWKGLDNELTDFFTKADSDEIEDAYSKHVGSLVLNE